MDLTIDGLFEVFVAGTIGIEAVGALTVAADAIAMTAASGASVAMDGFSMTLNADAINISDALYPVVRWSPDLMLWMSSITAILVGPPGPPVPVLTVGPTILPPALHTTPKVKV